MDPPAGGALPPQRAFSEGSNHYEPWQIRRSRTQQGGPARRKASLRARGATTLIRRARLRKANDLKDSIGPDDPAAAIASKATSRLGRLRDIMNPTSTLNRAQGLTCLGPFSPLSACSRGSYRDTG